MSRSGTTLFKKNDESMDDVDELSACLSAVSIQDTVRAVITTNNNFEELCSQLNSVEIGLYRHNALKEADIVAARVEKDLNAITRLHGVAKSTEEDEQRLMIVHVVQAYIRCLELDIEKWKSKLKLVGKSDQEIAAIKLNIREFKTWEQRKSSAPSYIQNNSKLEKPAGDTIVEQIAFVQLALNYWRSCYHYLSYYEKLIGAQPSSVERKLWELEQTTITYMDAATGNNYADINFSRLREPQNIDATGKPVSVAAIREMIQKQQEQAKYKIS